MTVKVGTTVRWVNDDAVFHTVTSTDSLDRLRPNGNFNRTLVARGDIFEHTFTRPGTFHYYCQPHSGFMTGTVRVVE